jgi:hypothetical protein
MQKRYLTIQVDGTENKPRIVVVGTDIEIAGIRHVSFDYDGTNGTTDCEATFLVFVGDFLDAVTQTLETDGC